MSEPRGGRWRFAPAATWAGLIWFASSFDWRKMPWRSPPGEGWLDRLLATLPSALAQHADKLVHALIFGLLALLLRRPSRLVGARAWLAAVVLTAAWGALDELHQGVVPGRSSDPWDLLADLLGAGLGAGLGAWLAASGRPPHMEPT